MHVFYKYLISKFIDFVYVIINKKREKKVVLFVLIKK
jgi:hypothetical protein